MQSITRQGSIDGSIKIKSRILFESKTKLSFIIFNLQKTPYDNSLSSDPKILVYKSIKKDKEKLPLTPWRFNVLKKVNKRTTSSRPNTDWYFRFDDEW